MNLLLELNYRQRATTHFLTGFFGFLTFLLIKDNTKACVALGAVLALMFKNPTKVFALAKTFKRDTIAGIRFLKLNIFVFRMERRGWSMARIFQETVKRHPSKPCFIMDERQVSFKDLDNYSSKVGSVFKSAGLKRGDCVALFLETKPEYVGFWLGLSKIGVTTALINSHLKKNTLLHSIQIAKAKAIIVDTELLPNLQEVLDLDDQVKLLPIYQFCEPQHRAQPGFCIMKDAFDLALVLEQQPLEDLSADIAACGPRDKLMYVYTSGTTGLPKAAIITELRYLFMSSATAYILNLLTQDVVYNPLPLYHTAGGIVGVGMALINGSTVVLRKKFSASNFWKDCIKYNCSVAQYIGELCRYLLSSPIQADDRKHNLRMMYGNGLRPQIWTQFATRFNIPVIGEVYGATEGNSNLANSANQVGAVGFIPLLLEKILPVQIVRVDEQTGEVIRNANGFCIRCAPGETGLLLGKVNSRIAVSAFHGYADEEASKKKLLRNVFSKADVYFNSGDMVVRDLLGFVYFKDRTGDTFRWRGENVATLEVEATISNVIGLKDCVVYGVEIPHVEGRAGMAAIVDTAHNIDMDYLSVGLRASLPGYARPLFIRTMKEIPHTATFKMKKRELMLEGFDLHTVKDPLYYLNKDGVYRALSEQQFQALLNGTAGL